MDRDANRNSSFMERVHASYVFRSRVRRLAAHLTGLLPQRSRVLDVGCGDGAIDRLLLTMRTDLTILGIDTLVRNNAEINVTSFDGKTIPYSNQSFDVVLFIDVLHHTEDPLILLKEAARVSRRFVVIKDHTADGFLAHATLGFMDRVGNSRYGVVLPYNYWKKLQWFSAFKDLGFTIDSWKHDLQLYPRPASWIFGRKLHFIARLAHADCPVFRSN